MCSLHGTWILKKLAMHFSETYQFCEQYKQPLLGELGHVYPLTNLVYVFININTFFTTQLTLFPDSIQGSGNGYKWPGIIMWVYLFHLMANEKSKRGNMSTSNSFYPPDKCKYNNSPICYIVFVYVLNAGIVTQMIMFILYRWVIYSICINFSHYSQK